MHVRCRIKNCKVAWCKLDNVDTSLISTQTNTYRASKRATYHVHTVTDEYNVNNVNNVSNANNLNNANNAYNTHLAPSRLEAQMAELLDVLRTKMTHPEKDTVIPCDDWRKIGMVMDRLFMVLLSVATIIIALASFMQKPPDELFTS